MKISVIPAKAGIQYRSYQNAVLSGGTSAVFMTTVLDPRLRGDDGSYLKLRF